jgi:small-conductance mechanosensitive channel
MDDVDIPGGSKIIETLQVGGIVTGITILFITWFLVRLITGALERSGNRFVHRRLLLHQIATLVRFIFYIGGIAAAIGVSINLSKEVVLALAGTVAVTIGFALKDLAASILAGLTLIVDRPFQVGDRITFDSYTGEIISIGLRSVRLTTQDGHVVTIPNNQVLTEAVASENFGRLEMMVALEFFVSADQEIATAKRIVEECMTSNRYIYLGKPWAVIVSQILLESTAAVKLLAQAHVLDMKYRLPYTTTVTERVLQAFREQHVLVPGQAPEPAPAAPAPLPAQRLTAA